MSYWEERITGSGVADRVERAHGIVESILADGALALALELREGLERLVVVLEITAQTITEAEPALVNEPAITDLVNTTQSVVSGLEAFAQAHDIAHLPGVTAATDAVVNALRAWPSPTSEGSVEDLRRRIGGLRALVTRTTGELEAHAEQLEARLGGATQEVDAVRASAVEEIEARRQAAVDSLAPQLASLEQRVAEQLPRLDEAISRSDSLFANAEQERAKRFEDSLAQQVDDAEQRLSERLTAIEQKAQKADEAAKRLIESLQARSKEASDLVGVIGRTGMTGGYQERAESERQQADRWRGFVVGFGLLAVVVLLWAVIEHKSSDSSGAAVAAKVALSAALGGLSTYAARQAHHHREAADRARGLELALASLPAYLEAVEPAEREKLLQVFAFVFFGPDTIAVQSSKAGDGPGLTGTAIQSLLDHLMPQIPKTP